MRKELGSGRGKGYVVDGLRYRVLSFFYHEGKPKQLIKENKLIHYSWAWTLNAWAPN